MSEKHIVYCDICKTHYEADTEDHSHETDIPTNQPSETPRMDLLDQNILHDLLELQAQGGKLSDMISHALTAYGKEARTLEKELVEAKKSNTCIKCSQEIGAMALQKKGDK